MEMLVWHRHERCVLVSALGTLEKCRRRCRHFCFSKRIEKKMNVHRTADTYTHTDDDDDEDRTKTFFIRVFRVFHVFVYSIFMQFWWREPEHLVEWKVVGGCNLNWNSLICIIHWHKITMFSFVSSLCSSISFHLIFSRWPKDVPKGRNQIETRFYWKNEQLQAYKM